MVIELGPIFSTGIGIVLGSIGTGALRRVTKKDCSTCPMFIALDNRVTVHGKILLRVSTAVGADVREYEELVQNSNNFRDTKQ